MNKRIIAFLLACTLIGSSITASAEDMVLSEESNEVQHEVIEEEIVEEETVMDEETAELVQKYRGILDSAIEVYASANLYETELAKFPSDYQKLLKELHKKYPNWIFKAVNTGLEWNDVVAGESYGTRSLISKSYADILLSKASGDYDTSTGKYIPKDGSTWVNVSDPGVAYFVDPRNYLYEESIFAMEYQGYDENCHTLAGIEAILKKTDLEDTEIVYTNTDGKMVTVSPAITYGEAILAAGKSNSISPLSLAARIKQETGGSLSNGSISGTYTYNGTAYTGYYNYYNIGATADTTKPPLVNGLDYAKSQKWTSPVLAIEGGAKFLAKNYISKGQNTVYFQKFNTVYKPYYSHQYMQNIAAPMSEARTTFYSYTSSELQKQFVFYIPVYKNMPSRTADIKISKNVSTAKPTLDLTLRKGPSTSYTKVTTIPAGATITVSGGVFTDDEVAYGQKLSNPYWMKVTYVTSSGKNYTGYVSLNYIEMDTAVTLKAGKSYSLKLSEAPSGETVYYETSDPAIATVDANGTVKGIAAGDCMIYAVTSSGQALDAIGFKVSKSDVVPAVPTLSSVKNSKSGVTITWKQSTNADGYYVYRKVSGGSWTKIDTVNSETKTSYIDTSASSGTTYSYTVSAYSGTKSSTYDSSGLSILRLDQPTVTVSDSDTASIKIKWKKITGASGYYVLRREGTSGSWEKIKTITKGTTVSCVYSGINTAEKEYFTVQAYGGSTTSSYASPGTSGRDQIQLSTPELKAVKNEESGIKISWNAVDYAQGYYVYRKTSGGSWKKIRTVSSGTTVNYIDSSVEAGNSYSYTVKAYVESIVGNYDKTGMTLLRLSQPIVTISSTGTNSVKLSWSKVPGAKGYYVYRRLGTSGSWTRIKTIKSGDTLTYTNNSLKTDTKYYYTVKAYNGSTYSSYLSSGVLAITKSITYTTYKTIVKVNYRTGAGTSYSKGGSLAKGTKVQVEDGYSKKANGYTWYRVKINSKKYYIASEYLTKVTNASTKKTYTTYQTTETVNYRTGAGTSYSKGGSLIKGTKVQVEDGYSKKANGYTWYRVKINSKNYYIASEYLKKV